MHFLIIRSAESESDAKSREESESVLSEKMSRFLGSLDALACPFCFSKISPCLN